MNKIKVSIIMPCFNVDKTIGRALDSILMQNTNFEYEVIAVDDASTDSTLKILNDYAAKDARIKVVRNESNLGNAKTFKKGSMMSRGAYLCVLDGDDFYTVRDKLQRQADFLDGDREKIYWACAHKYLTLHPDGKLGESPLMFAPNLEFSFLEFITQHFYSHTSTMMYRNVFKNLDIPVLDKQRGDTIRTLLAMGAAYGKIRILDFFGSVYTENPSGIWSSLDDEKKKKINLEAWRSCKNSVGSAREKRIIDTIIKRLEKMPASRPKAETFSLETYLRFFHHNLANRIAFGERDLIFAKLFKSDLIDSLCETVGYTSKLHLPSPQGKKEGIAIVISALNKTGGGIYQEILELAAMLAAKKITIILTDMAGIDELSDDVQKDFAPFRRLSFVFLKNFAERLSALQDKIVSLNPEKIYWYCGHNNVWADAALQRYGAKNIILFSFDHGLSLGLSNTNVDLFVAKTPKDYKLLSEHFGSARVIYIPCWSVPAATNRTYMPLANGKLVTATAAARFYKYQGDIMGSFQYFITNLLKKTGGRHIHYGPLPEEVKSRIARALKSAKIPLENFSHIEWAPALPDSMLENGVDLYIAPFPITSIKLGLQCLSAGIPVLSYAGGITRIEQTDFLGDVLKWKNRDDFFAIISSLDAEKLKAQSQAGLEYFRTHNDLAAAAPYVLLDRCFAPVPIPPRHIDSAIIDARAINDLLSFCYEEP